MFEEICSFQNLHLAYLKARKCKRYRGEILKFGYNLEANLLELQAELASETYQHGEYREFIVCDSKKRAIKAAPFRDRVVHHALCNIIEPIFEKGFIYDSYACRKEKGTHKAIKRLENFWQSAVQAVGGLKGKELYCLQCDISKYFNNIDHKILLSIIKKKISESKTLRLIEKIIDSSFDKKIYDNLFDYRLAGIPIGNLTSQLFANVYLNELDQFVKHNLRQRYYLRYMDDFLILSHDKKELHCLKEKLRGFLKGELRLTLHPKKANIFPVEKGIDFLGYRIFRHYRLLRKSGVKRFIRRTKAYRAKLVKKEMTQEKFNHCLQSWLAYAKFGNSWRLRQKLCQRIKI